MPEFQYWISGAAVFLAGSFGFAIIVGLIGIRNFVSERLFSAFIAAAILFSGLAWRTSAIQEKENAELQKNIRAIGTALKIDGSASASTLAKEILKHLPPKYPLTDEQTQRLSAVLNGIPQSERFHIDIFWPQLNGNQNHAKAVASVFSSANWDVSLRMAALVNGHGIVFAVPRDVAERKAGMPTDALRLMALLRRANIPYAVGALNNVPANTFAFVVGEPEK